MILASLTRLTPPPRLFPFLPFNEPASDSPIKMTELYQDPLALSAILSLAR